MNDDNILNAIAYLDTGFENRSVANVSHEEVMSFVRDVIQIEMAKQRHKADEDLSAQVASLEARMLAMRREFMKQRGHPSVTYVSRHRDALVTRDMAKDILASSAYIPPTPINFTAALPAIPRAMVAFYSLGLACSLVFATLLALSAAKVQIIHPFISLLGLIGGLGWLTTAWTDLLLWKRENPSAYKSSQEERPIPTSNAR
jgi:hypothetical protein